MAITDAERRNAVDAAIGCFGTANVLNRRARNLNRFIVSLRFSGLLGVALVGIVVTLVPGNNGDFTWVAWVASLLSIVNFCASLVSMNWAWDQKYHNYMESIKENNWLSGQFNELFRDTALSDKKWREKYENIKNLDSRRKEKDTEMHLKDNERHLGYRAGLLQFQQTCGQCGLIPPDMKSTDCHSCGQF